MTVPPLDDSDCSLSEVCLLVRSFGAKLCSPATRKPVRQGCHCIAGCSCELLKPGLLIFGEGGNLHSIPVRQICYSMCCCCCCCCCWMIADDPFSHSPVLSSDAAARNPQQAVKQYWAADFSCPRRDPAIVRRQAQAACTLTSMSLTLLSQQHGCVVVNFTTVTLALTYKLAWAAGGQPNKAVSSKVGAPEVAYQLCH